MHQFYESFDSAICKPGKRSRCTQICWSANWKTCDPVPDGVIRLHSHRRSPVIVSDRCIASFFQSLYIQAPEHCDFVQTRLPARWIVLHALGGSARRKLSCVLPYTF